MLQLEDAVQLLLEKITKITDVEEIPEYMTNTGGEVSTGNFYWTSRLIAAMADASYSKSVFHIERYDELVMAKSHEIVNRCDEDLEKEEEADARLALRTKANAKITDMVKKEASDTLGKVLYELSSQMKNAYSRSDA